MRGISVPSSFLFLLSVVMGHQNDNNTMQSSPRIRVRVSPISPLRGGRRGDGRLKQQARQERRRSLSSPLAFALINGGSPFFEPAEIGWQTECDKLNVACDYYKSSNEDSDLDKCATVQEGLLQNITQAQLDGAAFLNGLAIAPCRTDRLSSPIRTLVEAGVPVVTFDADSPDSSRLAFVSTDNRFMGITMANVVKQLRPEGGTFILISGNNSNLQERDAGFREEILKDGKSRWYELPPSSLYLENRKNMSESQPWVDRNPTAFVTMYQSAMRDPNWTEFVDFNRQRNITFVGSDDADFQLDFLHSHYVNGLVGQLPADMASVSLEVLYENAIFGSVSKDFYATNLVSHTLVPVDLPPHSVDQNLIGNLKYVGYTFFSVIVLLALLCATWTQWHKRTMVVKAAQPFFLMMVASGVIVLAGTLIPLSFDDKGDPDSMSETYSIGICMSIPWLAFIGFTVVFSALFAKTWRVNRLFHAKVHHARIVVTRRDVLTPFFLLLASNVLVLLCWTIIDPLTYVRQDNEGTDIWNRVISSYGACRSDDATPYLVPLAVMNFGVLVVASWQAYQARDIKSEFSESTYIALAVFSSGQAFLTGLPLLIIVKDEPQAFYVLMCLMVFLLCMAILVFIFFPKIKMERAYSNMSERGQKQAMAESVRISAGSPNMKKKKINGSNGSVSSVESGSGLAGSSSDVLAMSSGSALPAETALKASGSHSLNFNARRLSSVNEEEVEDEDEESAEQENHNNKLSVDNSASLRRSSVNSTITNSQDMGGALTSEEEGSSGTQPHQDEDHDDKNM